MKFLTLVVSTLLTQFLIILPTNGLAQTGSSTKVPQFADAKQLEEFYKSEGERLNARRTVVEKVLNDLYWGVGNQQGKLVNEDNHGVQWHEEQLIKLSSEYNSLSSQLDKAREERDFRKANELTQKLEANHNLTNSYKGTLKKEDAYKKLTDLNKEMSELDSKLKAVDRDKSQAKLTLDGRLAKQDARYSAMTLESDVKDGLGDADKLTAGYEGLANRYDNKLIKVYMWQKFDNLLNSNALCESVSSCNGSTREASKVKPYDLKEVFPNVVGSKRYSANKSGTTGAK